MCFSSQKARTLGLVTALAIITLLFAPLTGLAAPPGGHLNVDSVAVDLDAGTLTITGTDLDFGGALEVTLAQFPPLLIIGIPTDTEIVTNLPPAIDAGDYLLTVSRGNGQSENDEYDLTIGAVGPEGPQGKPGVQGDVGPKGDKGDQGDPGIQGVKGDQGDQGIQGVKGDQGPQGVAGANGVNGGQGPQGVPGISGYVRVLSPQVGISSSGQSRATATCPAGKKVLGGGHLTSSALVFAFDSWPETDSTWTILMRNIGGSSHWIQAWAVCASVQ